MSKNIETIALAKAIKEAQAKAARAAISAGEYQIDEWVHITGSVKVGEDYEQRIVAKAQPWDLLAVALSKLNGVTVEALVREALDGSIAAEEIKAQADAAMETIKGETVTTCKGKVTTKLTVEFADGEAA